MQTSPETSAYAALPSEIPVFPLSGALLLPSGQLPLKIFEPRYLNMVSDALGKGRIIGMIQPRNERDAGTTPALFEVGCAGRITQFTETPDGRFLITLSGVSRFECVQEHPTTRGYRLMTVGWERFEADRGPGGNAQLDRERLMISLKRYFEQEQITVDWKVIEGTEESKLITTLSMICPFSSSEKQALLEAPDCKARGEALIALLEMRAPGFEGGSDVRH